MVGSAWTRLAGMEEQLVRSPALPGLAARQSNLGTIRKALWAAGQGRCRRERTPAMSQAQGGKVREMRSLRVSSYTRSPGQSFL